MKNKWLLLSLCLSYTTLWANPDNDPVLMKINGKDVKKSEFEYIYNKNKGQQLEKKTFDEYVTLFVNYKLKVTEAQANGLDTTKAFINELAKYRKPVAKPYLVDRSVDEALVKEAYDRLTENVEVSHILFRVSPNATDAEKQSALKKANEILSRIKKGEDFGALAQEYSEDPSAKQNKGYLGYITGFYTVYPFESGAYNTPVGKISEPVLSDFGYHLIKVHNRRPDRGEVRVAHILLTLPAQASDAQKKAAEEKANNLYKQLKEGADFAKLAKENSEDPSSAAQGGEMPFFGSGRLVKEFEDAAFALQNTGDISAPVQSSFGWHIIKLLEKKPVAPFSAMKSNIERRLQNDERGSKGQKALIDKLKIDYRMNIAPVERGEIVKKAVAFTTDSAFVASLLDNSATLLSFAGEKRTVADFANYYKKYCRKPVNEDALDFITKQVERFADKELLSYEDTQLENKYPEFNNLIREYHDGILLFEISNREVWDKASKDEKGRTAFFKKNKKKYGKQNRFIGYAIQCKDKEIEQQVRAIIKSEPNDSILAKVKALNNDSVQNVIIEKGRFLQGANPIVDKMAFNVQDAQPAKMPIAFVEGACKNDYPEQVDMMGAVILDYQNYLEKLWLKSLKKKYAVEINKDVLKTVNRQ